MSRRVFLKTLAAFAAVSSAGQLALGGQSPNATPKKYILSIGGEKFHQDALRSSKPVIKVIGIGDLGEQVVNDLLMVRSPNIALETHSSLTGANLLLLVTDAENPRELAEAARIAELSKSMGVFTVGVTTQYWPQSLDDLSKHVDSMLVSTQYQGITSSPTQEVRKTITMLSQLLCNSDQVISTDIHDLRLVLENSRSVVMHGVGSGTDRAIAAARQAMSSTAFQDGKLGMEQRALIIVSASRTTLKLQEIKQVTSIISSKTATDAAVLLGVVLDETAEDQLFVTVIKN